MHTASARLGELTERQIERFWSKVDTGGPDSCWPWKGSLHEKGYGTWSVSIKGSSTSIRPHRLAWHLTNGPIPDGLVVDHRCQMRACVNPRHLDVVDHGENLSRVAPTGQAAPLARLLTALLATRSDSGLRAWWEEWLAADDYTRRRLERDALSAGRRDGAAAHLSTL